MSKPKIAIIGLGVIGTSLGLALRASTEEYEIIGHDRDPGAARAAAKAGAVHKTEWNLIATAADADAIVLALPANAIRDTLENIAEDLKIGAVLTDTASVKAQVMQDAQELLPDNVSFVGGDPILPTGQTGLEPSADLFRGGVYCLIPSATAAPVALDFLTDMVQRIGAQPFFLDAVEHDSLIAGGEHLPLVIAAALLRATQASVSWREMRKVAGTTYEYTGFLGSEDHEAHREGFLANSANIVRWLDAFSGALQELRDLIEEGDEAALDEALRHAVDLRQTWMKERALKEWDRMEQMMEPPERPSFLRQAFLGSGFPRSREEEEKDDKQGKKR